MRIKICHLLLMLLYIGKVCGFRGNARKRPCIIAHAGRGDAMEGGVWKPVLKAPSNVVKPLIIGVMSIFLQTPVHARTDFMSPEAEGGGGRFGKVASPKSQAPAPVVQSKIGGNSAGTQPKKGFQTKTGLKYFDIREGDGQSPRYGDLVTFQYFMYYKPPERDAQLELIARSKEPYLQKHGNGRIVRGLDEGLHTMKEGGRRRIIVPKSIGYTGIGIGPLPEEYSARQRLGYLIDVLQEDKGELIFDVELEQVLLDENDQGYYEDIPVTQDEVRELVAKTIGKNKPTFTEQKKEDLN